MQFIQNPYAQLHHVGEIKSVALTFYTTVAIVLLDGQFWKKRCNDYSFNLRTNYLLRLHVHPYFIKYHSLVYPTICN